MKKLLLMMLLLFVLLVSTVASIDYNDAVIKGDLINFEFCFNPDLEKEFYKENFVPYVDVVSGCEILEQRVIAKLPVKLTSTVYYDEISCLWKDDKTQIKVNDSYPQIQECTTVTKSKTSNEDVIEVYDLEQTDILFQKEMSLCVIAKRRANTNYQSCDVNLNIDMNNDGDFTDLSDIKIVDDGFAWWNATWATKYLINVSASGSTEGKYKLIFNSTYITMSDCQVDGGDVRFTNYAQDTALIYNLSNWNITTGTVFINESSVTDSAIYLYCNASSPQTTTSTALTEDIPTLHYDCNGDYNDRGRLGDKDLSNVGTGQSFDTTTQKIGSGACEYTNAGASATANSTGLATGNVNHSYSFWQNLDVIDVDYHIGVGNVADPSGSSLQYQVTAVDFVLEGANTVSATPPNLNVWEYMTFVYWANETIEYYVNGSHVSSIGGSISTFNMAFGDAYAFCLNSRSGDCLSAVMGDGSYDDVRYYERSLSAERITQLYNSDVGTEESITFFASPAYVVGAGEGNVVLTGLSAGLYNTSFVNISLNVQEGQDFIVWANYSYDTNGSAVSGGTCNFSADNILSEDYQENVGVNFTVCTSGCDSVNKSFVFTGLHTKGFINDIFRFKLCKEGSSPVKEIFISSNHSAFYTLTYPAIPLCSVGYINVSVVDANSSGVSSLELSISTDASSAKALVLVDSFGGVDRLHNASGNLTFNVSTQTWVDDVHEYYSSGTHNISVSCYDGAGIENQSTNLSVTVGNIAPTIFIDSIWWWSLSSPVVFTPSIQAKYPLSNTLNVTGGCQDTDLFNAGVYLNYSNGTNIYSVVFSVSDNQVPSSVNFSQSNFSTNVSYLNGALEYKFQGYCNDSNNNISTIIRSFSAVNNIPVSTWVSSGGNIGVIPTTYNFSCVDDEGESMTAYVFVNGTLNTSGSITGFVFNYPEGSYELNVSCADSFRNSTQDSITVVYTPDCLLDVYGLITGERYRDTTVLVSANCSNGIVLSSCEYSINGYSTESFNCSGANLTLELGRNLISINVSDGANSVNEDFQVFAKKVGSTFADYILLFLLIILLVIIIWFSNFVFDAGITHLFVVGVIGLLGYFCIALSMWVSVIVWCFALFYAVSKLF